MGGIMGKTQFFMSSNLKLRITHCFSSTLLCMRVSLQRKAGGGGGKICVPFPFKPPIPVVI